MANLNFVTHYVGGIWFAYLPIVNSLSKHAHGHGETPTHTHIHAESSANRAKRRDKHTHTRKNRNITHTNERTYTHTDAGNRNARSRVTVNVRCNGILGERLYIYTDMCVCVCIQRVFWFNFELILRFCFVLWLTDLHMKPLLLLLCLHSSSYLPKLSTQCTNSFENNCEYRSRTAIQYLSFSIFAYYVVCCFFALFCFLLSAQLVENCFTFLDNRRPTRVPLASKLRK